jgi:lipopolysaccharide export system permease protein
MKRLDRYILKELLVPFLIGTLAVVLMFQANDLMRILKQFQLQSVPFKAVLQIVLYRTPEFLQLTLPVGTALAASLAVSRLSRESEITAMRASGVRIWRVLRPIGIAGIVVALCSYILIEKLVPISTHQAKKVETEASILGSGPQFRSNVIMNLKTYTASFGSVASSPDKTIQLTDILLIERPKPGSTQVIGAKTGTYKNGIWELRDTYFWMITGDSLVDARPGKNIVINERITIADMFTTPDAAEQTATQLRDAITAGRKAGRDMTVQQIAYNCKYSLPTACAVLALVGPLFAVWLSRNGAFIGVLLSIVLVFLYYNVYVVSTQILGQNGYLNPWLAAWLPNILFVGLGIFALRRLE